MSNPDPPDKPPPDTEATSAAASESPPAAEESPVVGASRQKGGSKPPRPPRPPWRVTARQWRAWGIAALVAALVLGLALARDRWVHTVGAVDDEVIVERDEVVQDSLIVSANSVRIDGTVIGDVFVAAPRVVISGKIIGNLDAVAGDLEIEVEGIVAGSVHCACEDAFVRGRVGGSLYAVAKSLSITRMGRVVHDVLSFAPSTRADGAIGRDLRVYGNRLWVSGSVGRDVRGAVRTMVMPADTRVGRDIDLSVPEAQDVIISPDAAIAGQTRLHEHAAIAGATQYARPAYYAVQFLQLVGAFIVGLLLVRVFPRLVTVPIRGARGMLAGLGIGLLVLVLAPIGAGVAVATVIGLPLGLIALATYLAALYVAAIVVAARLGVAMLGSKGGNRPLALVLGLLVVAVATELPLIGGWVSVGVTVYGLGVMIRALQSPRRTSPA